MCSLQKASICKQCLANAKAELAAVTRTTFKLTLPKSNSLPPLVWVTEIGEEAQRASNSLVSVVFELDVSEAVGAAGGPGEEDAAAADCG